MAIDLNDLLLVKAILASVVAAMLVAWITHVRAARGSSQVARQNAELRLQHADRGAWIDAVHALRLDIDGRVRSLEEKIKHVPSSTDFAELEGEVKRIATQYESLADGQAVIRATLFRIEDFLLKGKRP